MANITIDGKQIKVEQTAKLAVEMIDRRVRVASLDQPDGRREARQVAQAEEVDLQQPGGLDVPHLPLGRDDVLVLFLVGQPLERAELDQGPVGDHDAGSVDASVLDAGDGG